MPSVTLTDIAQDLWVEGRTLGPADFGLDGPAWSITKRTLHGGRREGVDVIEVDNGDLSFTIVPTRGMGLWTAAYRGERIGWRSPVTDGPVNPSFVQLEAWGGLGWLNGFDELLARCGLEWSGPPYRDGDRTYTLHGKIANVPARFVAVHVADEPPHAITIEGVVVEAKLFAAQLQLRTKVTTTPGSNRLTVRDEFTNLSDSPGTMQALYHWNFGPPRLEEGSRFVAPWKTVCPINAGAAEGIGHHDVYGPPQPGRAEQVYLYDLHGEGDAGRTVAMLRNRAGDKGAALRFATKQLPCFTMWKNTRGLGEGYVTGLEPATNYPNPRPFEAERGRVLRLEPGASHVAETTLEVFDDAGAIAEVEREIGRLQAVGAPTIHARPVEPFAPAG